MQVKAKEDLARLFNDALAKAGLAAASVETFATPRRLALIATGLPLATDAVSEETKGPKDGAPPQAMEGFLRKAGLTQDQLIEREACISPSWKRQTQTADVLAEAIPAIFCVHGQPLGRGFGFDREPAVRPLQGIVALLATTSCRAKSTVSSGAATMGHRFTQGESPSATRAIISKTRACHVMSISPNAARSFATAQRRLLRLQG
jgi:glycyl-tRNA synthetase beta chain